MQHVQAADGRLRGVRSLIEELSPEGGKPGGARQMLGIKSKGKRKGKVSF